MPVKKPQLVRRTTKTNDATRQCGAARDAALGTSGRLPGEEEEQTGARSELENTLW